MLLCDSGATVCRPVPLVKLHGQRYGGVFRATVQSVQCVLTCFAYVHDIGLRHPDKVSHLSQLCSVTTSK
jgi:hypothetical protein